MYLKQAYGYLSRVRSWFILFLFLAALVTACDEPEEDPIVVTEVATIEGQEVIVTRIVHQRRQIEITPIIPENPDPVHLDISLSGIIATLDPQISAGEPGVQIIDNIFAGLTRYNHRANTIDPELAESWELDDDGRTWTFNLRDDIYWVRRNQSEGLLSISDAVEPIRPVTAADVVYSVQRACDSELATPDVFILFIIEGCEAVYEMTEVTEENLGEIGARAIDAVYIGSESHPYAVKPTSTILASALNMSDNLMTADMQFACKGGTAALQLCFALSKAGMAKHALAIGADTAQSEPGDMLEYSAAAAGAAFIVGNENIGSG